MQDRREKIERDIRHFLLALLSGYLVWMLSKNNERSIRFDDELKTKASTEYVDKENRRQDKQQSEMILRVYEELRYIRTRIDEKK